MQHVAETGRAFLPDKVSQEWLTYLQVSCNRNDALYKIAFVMCEL